MRLLAFKPSRFHLISICIGLTVFIAIVTVVVVYAGSPQWLRLNHGDQDQEFTMTNGSTKYCVDNSDTTNDFFVPNNTDTEFNSFCTAVNNAGTGTILDNLVCTSGACPPPCEGGCIECRCGTSENDANPDPLHCNRDPGLWCSGPSNQDDCSMGEGGNCDEGDPAECDPYKFYCDNEYCCE